jgi:hypothetical protein
MVERKQLQSGMHLLLYGTIYFRMIAIGGIARALAVLPFVEK